MRRKFGLMMGVALVVMIAVAGCGAKSAAPATVAAPAADQGGNAAAPGGQARQDYTSNALPTSYDNAVPAGTQLALGIFRLEGSPLAVTPAQAKTLLPLWQALQGNAVQNQTEQNAVLKQIEGTLSADQVKAIAGMYLTTQDMRDWMDKNGMQLRPPANLTPGAPGTPGANGTFSDAQRQAFRATVEANGGQFPQGGQGGNFGNMTDAQRQAFRATAQASGRLPNGTPGPGGRGGARFFGSYRLFVQPLVDLLTKRAAQ